LNSTEAIAKPEGELLWTPDPARVRDANISHFMSWLKDQSRLSFRTYEELWQWSITDLQAFWRAIADYFEVHYSTPYTSVLEHAQMPGARWFPGASLNYAERALSHERADTTALMYASEGGELRSMSWSELAGSVRILATQLRRLGVRPGERVVAILPNTPQAVIALLASASIGAVWSCCAPDYGPTGIVERLAQLEPKVVFLVDGYRYGGKRFDRRSEMQTILSSLPTLQHAIVVRNLDPEDARAVVPGEIRWEQILQQPAVPAAQFQFEQVPFDHPLWVLFSSGTTGLPKGIVHGHGGIVLEHLKHLSFNYEVKAREALFFFTSTGWMIWNFLAGSLLADVVPVLYDGNPAHPGPDALWKVVERSGAVLFGTSPTYVVHQRGAGVVPRANFDLTRLRAVTLAGSPVTGECMRWFYDNVKDDLWVASGSGGTDCCTGFVGGVGILPVYAGEIQARALGCAAYAYNAEGAPVVDEVGEFVITQPMPSMPLYLWNDPGGTRYRETYFDQFPGVWRHGDFAKFNARGGSFVLGRSDATLNRYGIRIGTAEIYRSLEGIKEIEDSLILNLDLPGGNFFMPLFVKLRGDRVLDEELKGRIAARLRREYSPRHVPDRIMQVDGIPMTLTGKKMEVPVRRVLMGVVPERAANRSAIANPEAWDYFVSYARTQTDYSLAGQ
jgi:acetoacetyl-CoA synthetase